MEAKYQVGSTSLTMIVFSNHSSIFQLLSQNVTMHFPCTHRGQEQCEDRDTPDSFVPSSSPESVVGMEISRYPDLSLVKEEPPSPSLSPVIPMFPVFRGKGN